MFTELRPVDRNRSPETISFPAPVGGWNPRDSLDAMPPTDAIKLENWFPDADKVKLRDGYLNYATGASSGDVEFIYDHQDATSSDLLVAGGTALYSANAATAVTSLGTGFTSARWQAETVSGVTLLVNSADTPQSWNGTALSTAGLSGTGLTVTTLSCIRAFKGRVYFGASGSADIWYSGVGAVTGALTLFQLSQIAKGGYVSQIGTWSRDSGDGPDDYIAFIMSTGEIIVYQGTDPASSTTWGLVGAYHAAPPIGRNCIEKLGGELVILTEGGVMPLSIIMAGGGGPELDNHPIWGKIRPALQKIAKTNGTRFGWHIREAAQHDAVIINIPTSSTTSEQYVVNAVTGAWCRFTSTNVNPLAWANLAGVTYVAERSGRVLSYSGKSDRGVAIMASAKTAFSYMGDRGSRKRWSAMRPIIASEGIVIAQVGIDVDFTNRSALSTTTLSNYSGGAAWDTFAWDSTPWGREAVPSNRWVTAQGLGRAAAVRFDSTLQGQEVYWYATQFIGQRGGVL